jgi:hypothetical protein
MADAFVPSNGAPSLPSAVQPGTISVTFANVTPPALQTFSVPGLSFVPVSVGSPPDPTLNIIINTSALDNLGAPPTAPVLSYPGAPTQPNLLVPSQPPIDLNFVYPDVNVSLPTPPALLSIQTVPFDGVTIPPLNATEPVLNIIQPRIVQYVEGAMYSSVLLTQAEADLQRAITDGTWTGLNPQAENALWDRGREREYRQKADAIMELERMEAMGFAFPPGVYMDARYKIETELNKTAAGISREIFIKQAELQLENVTKARGLVVQLESVLIEYANKIAQRAFENAKYQTEAGVSIYNANVQAYTAKVEAYKAAAVIYEAQIRGLLATVEAYKAQIEAERVKAEINTSLVQQYKVQVEAALAQIEIFKGKIQIIQTQAEIEKLKIQAYGEEVRAYSAQIGAFTANVEAYKAQVEGQTARAQAYKAQVDGFAAQVNAAAQSINARVEVAKEQIQAKSLQLEAYKAGVQAAALQVQAQSAAIQATAEGYKAQASMYGAYDQALAAMYGAQERAAAAAAEVSVSAQSANVQANLTTQQISMDYWKVAAQVAAQVKAAELAQHHYTENTNTNKNDSTSKVTTESKSTNTNYNNSTNTNFNY